MSLVETPLPVHVSLPQDPPARKRTSSFSYPNDIAFSPNPRPSKAARTTEMGSSLRRSESLLCLPGSQSPSFDPYALENANRAELSELTLRTLQHYKEQRLRRKSAVVRATGEPITIRTRPDISQLKLHVPQQIPARATSSAVRAPAPSTTKPRKLAYTPKRNLLTLQPPSQVILPSVSSPITIVRTQRTTSPLSPNRTILPGRPVFPRSKQEPDLYRTAIKTRMSYSPEGKKILMMGARLAVNIETATRELERIVADQTEQERERDNDVVMTDCSFRSPSSSSLAKPVLTASWVIVKGDDWEMVDCMA